MQSEIPDLFITNEVLSPTELLGQVEGSVVSKYSGMLNRNLWHQQPTPTKYGKELLHMKVWMREIRQHVYVDEQWYANIGGRSSVSIKHLVPINHSWKCPKVFKQNELFQALTQSWTTNFFITNEVL
jgi:hypothetical protein